MACDPFNTGSLGYSSNATAAALQNGTGQAANARAMNHIPAIFSPHEAHPNIPSGVTLGEIIGWRAWRVAHPGVLKSMAVDHVWRPNETIDGDPDLGYGVHAWRHESGARAYGRHGLLIAIGRIAMWGVVIEHDDGWRAEHARVVSIDGLMGGQLPKRQRSQEAWLARLRKAYGVSDRTPS